MPAIKPIKRKDLIRFLRKLDFFGPYSGGKHHFMVKGEIDPFWGLKVMFLTPKRAI